MTLQTFLAQGKKVCAEATEGPWYCELDGGYNSFKYRIVDPASAEHRRQTGHSARPMYFGLIQKDGDASFIAFARTALPKALEAISLYQRYVEALKAASLRGWYVTDELDEVERLIAKLETDL